MRSEFIAETQLRLNIFQYSANRCLLLHSYEKGSEQRYATYYVRYDICIGNDPFDPFTRYRTEH